MKNQIRKKTRSRLSRKSEILTIRRRGIIPELTPSGDGKDVQAIKKLLSDNPRDLLLFTMGINNGLRVGDLLRLRVKDVKHLKEGGSIVIKESKTDRENTLMVNKPAYKASDKQTKNGQKIVRVTIFPVPAKIKDIETN